MDGVGNAHQQGPQARGQGAEAPVVEAAAHAQAVALPVKGGQGRQHQVQGQGPDPCGLRRRLLNAEAVDHQGPVWTVGEKAHAVAALHHRQGQRLAQFVQAAQQGAQVGFAVDA